MDDWREPWRLDERLPAGRYSGDPGRPYPYPVTNTARPLLPACTLYHDRRVARDA